MNLIPSNEPHCRYNVTIEGKYFNDEPHIQVCKFLFLRMMIDLKPLCIKHTCLIKEHISNLNEFSKNISLIIFSFLLQHNDNRSDNM